MLLMLSLPVLINTHYILVIWLKLVPEHAVLFVQLILIFAMCESISNPLVTAMLATGKIRNYQIIVGGLQMLNLPISYVCLKLGCIPESVLIVAIVISQSCLVARLYMLRSMIGLSSVQYMKKVYFNIIVVALLAIAVPGLLSKYLEESLLSFVILSFAAIVCTIIVEFYVGCNGKEREFVVDKVKNLKNKVIKK